MRRPTRWCGANSGATFGATFGATLSATLCGLLVLCGACDDAAPPETSLPSTHADVAQDAVADTGAIDGACSSDLDCRGDADTVCRFGACDQSSHTCTMVSALSGTPCVDGDPCTAESACADGVCAGLGTSACQCATDKDCAPLDDGDACTGTLHCDLSVAPFRCRVKPGSVPQCDDGSPCTQETCDPATGACKTTVDTCSCKTTADCDAQEDGDLCNGTLYCDSASHTCKVNPATVIQCSSAKDGPCAVNSCLAATGACAFVPVKNGTPCDDGDACTGGELCLQGSCQGGTGICPCTSNADCVAKDDGDLCNGLMYCDVKSGSCLVNAASVVTCPTVLDSPCTKNVCDPLTGLCGLADEATGTVCDDGDPCTGSTTCTNGVCGGGPNLCLCTDDASCANQEDGDLCNGTLFCEVSTGTCKVNPATAVVCPSAGDKPCVKNTCQAKTGACALTVLPNAAKCEDGDVCTVNEQCQSGACVAGVFVCECADNAACALKDDGDLCNGTWFCDKFGAKPVCAFNPASAVFCSKSADEPCLKNRCDPKTGACSLQPELDGKPCTHPSKCAAEAVCAAAACTVTTATDCDDANPCTVDGCTDGGGCTHSKVPCDDGNPCTQDSCHGGTGACVFDAKAMQGKNCDADGNGCTVNDTCSGGSCKAGLAVLCKGEAGPCEAPTCVHKGPLAYACAVLPKADGAPCSDGDGCKIGATCSGGTCGGGTVDKLYALQRQSKTQGFGFDAAAWWGAGPVVVGWRQPAGGGRAWYVERLGAGGTSLWTGGGAVATESQTTAVGASGVVVDDSGLAVVAGTVATQDAGLQLHVRAYASGGAVAWQRTHGAKGAHEQARRLVAHPSSGFVVVGEVVAGALSDGWLSRLSSTGLAAWSWSAGGTGADALNGAVGRADGATLVAGHNGSVVAGSTRGWLALVDAQGKTVWSQALTPLTGTADRPQVLEAVAGDGAGGYLAAGWHADGALRHPWWVHIGAGGKVTHQRTTSVAGAIHDIAVPGAGTRWSAGFADLSGKAADPWLAGWDASSLATWSRVADKGGVERLRRVAALPAGGLLAVGTVDAGAQAQGLLLVADAWGRDSCASAGVCASKSVSTCDDAKPCTDDLCDAKSGCLFAHTTKPCEDGDACTEGDACSQGLCKTGAVASCDDGNACTKDSCDKTQGCTHAALDQQPCPDDSVCTKSEVCAQGTCTSVALNCDDGNPCTQDTCDAKQGCQHAALPDEQPCATGKVCVAGACIQRWAVELAAGADATCARHPGGKVSCWGKTGIVAGVLNNQHKSVVVPNLPDAVDIEVGRGTMCARVAGGGVSCWGGTHGLAGNGTCATFGYNTVAQAVPKVAGAKALVLGYDVALTLDGAGVVLGWGNDYRSALGRGTCNDCRPTPLALKVPAGVTFVGTGRGAVSCVGTAAGATWCAGGTCVNTHTEGKCGCLNKQLGWPGSGQQSGAWSWVAVPQVTSPVAMASGLTHRCLLDKAGAVRCWGKGDGTVGDGSKTLRTKPVLIALPGKAVSIAAGVAHTCAVLADGGARCWGVGKYGALGTGNEFNQLSPAPVQGLTNAVSVVAGNQHTCALRADGSVHCWGRNGEGQLGLSKSYGRLTPYLVPASKAK